MADPGFKRGRGGCNIIKLKNITGTEYLKLSLFHQLCKIFSFFLDLAYAVGIFPLLIYSIPVYLKFGAGAGSRFVHTAPAPAKNPGSGNAGLCTEISSPRQNIPVLYR